MRIARTLRVDLELRISEINMQHFSKKCLRAKNSVFRAFFCAIDKRGRRLALIQEKKVNSSI